MTLAAALLSTLGYFHGGGGNNQNSRLDLTRALVEEHRIVIDSFHTNTDDKVLYHGHYYSNKAPGQPVLAVPAVALARAAFSWRGRDPRSSTAANWMSWAGTVFTASLPATVAVFALAWIAIQLGASTAAGWFCAITYAIATPTWAYASLYCGHLLAASWLVLAFAAALSLREPGSLRRDLAIGVALGTTCGLAVLTEYGAAPAALIVGGMGSSIALRRPGGSAVRALVGVGVGGLACLIAMLGYHAACFGSPWLTPMALYFANNHVDHYFVMPSVQSLNEILLGDAHGLLPLSPILCVAPLGYLLAPREHRGPVLVAALIVISFVVINCSFWIPGGGWGFGPRYLAPALPFLCLPLAFIWDRGGAPLRTLILPVVAFGAAVALMAVSVKPEPPEYVHHPVSDFLWPAFRDGDLSVNYQSMLENGIADWPQHFRGNVHAHQAFNLGEQLGLRGGWSLAPIAGVWLVTIGVLTFLAWRRRRRPVS